MKTTTKIETMTNTEKTNRVKTDWENTATESVDVQLINDTFYGFCSELASLRLLKAYRSTDKADCGYSDNRKTFYFRLETNG